MCRVLSTSGKCPYTEQTVTVTQNMGEMIQMSGVLNLKEGFDSTGLMRGFITDPCATPPSPRQELVYICFLSPHLSSPSLPPNFIYSAVAHEHLKERGLFGLPPPPPGTSPAEFYHLMASHRSPYGDLLLQGAGASAGPHLSDYITPIDGECPGSLIPFMFECHLNTTPTSPCGEGCLAPPHSYHRTYQIRSC